MAGIVPGIDRYEIAHTTLYRVHQRVAETFRKGRAFLSAMPRMSTIRSAAWA